MQMKRRGVETRLVLPGVEIVTTQSDPVLLRALARGYQWFSELVSGKACHLVPLALLAPSVVEPICMGRQTATLSAERLKSLSDVPIEWSAQQRVLSE